ALENDQTPSVLALTRQGLPQLRGEGDENWSASSNRSAKGAYRLKPAGAARKVVLVATGSEVALAMDVAATLASEGIGADVVSMPCMELFEAQDASYRADIFPRNVLKVSIEAGTTLGWERFVGNDGLTIGLDGFGASAPADQLFAKFGFSVEAIVPKIMDKLNG